MSGEKWCFPVTCVLTPQHCLCEQVMFVNGQAVFTLQSIKLDSALHEKLIDDLKSVLSTHKKFGDIKEDLSLLPKGESAACLCQWHACLQESQKAEQDLWDCLHMKLLKKQATKQS